MSPERPTGFHEGERAVQLRTGVTAEADRLSGMLDPPSLDGGAHRFLAAQEFAVFAARDASGRLWASPIVAPEGFLDARGQTLTVKALPAAGDPLSAMPAGQSIGVIAIDFARRRRLRVNGTLVTSDETGFTINVDQAYGNCPQFIHRREIHSSTAENQARPVASVERGSALTEPQRLLIGRADTFFLGTTHPSRGNDASHRGGPPGFVQATAHELWWPDYPGNNMFNSLGNLTVDATTGILFLDFTNGDTLHLSGTATIEWDPPDSPKDDAHTGRGVRFVVNDVIHLPGALHARFTHPEPRPHTFDLAGWRPQAGTGRGRQNRLRVSNVSRDLKGDR
ncbi:pyridoxamine 5'-phosphate oxidase family protein [Streptosporangium subroseum]|uniref:pyridoxamine 5'-phosphate oxidase family protein n=1 Tax=Streptosporangium subroseum TaxID=106412 RepID=UPI0034195CE1